MRILRALSAVIVCGAVAATSAPTAFADRVLPGSNTLPQGAVPVRANAIVWGDQVFSTPAPLAAWLVAHGRSYRRWAAFHPADRAIIEQPTPASQSANSPTSASAQQLQHPYSKQVALGAPAEASQPRSHARQPDATKSPPNWVLPLLTAVALLAMLVSLAPRRLLGFAAIRALTATRRTYLFAAGFSICMGALVARMHG